ALSASSALKQQCLNLRPLPQGHGSLRPVDDIGRWVMGDSADAIAIVHQCRFPRRSSRSLAVAPNAATPRGSGSSGRVSRRKTAAFDLTTLSCCAVGTTFRHWLDV